MNSYKLSAEARIDYFAASDFLAEYSPLAALAWEDRMLAAFSRLADWSHSGRIRPEYAPDFLRFWAEGDYLVVYDPSSKPLTIVAILHGALNLTAILAERLGEGKLEGNESP